MAKQHSFLIFTHDLDFGAILAMSNAPAPSVLQIRRRNFMPEYLGQYVLSFLSRFENFEHTGMLITLDDKRLKFRVLPIYPEPD